MCSGTRGFPCGLLYRDAGPKAVPTMFERSVGDVGPTFFFLLDEYFISDHTFYPASFFVQHCYFHTNTEDVGQQFCKV